VATEVLSFHIEYVGLEDRIWRDIEVSSKMGLDKLGYTVLASFDTKAYHLFDFKLRGEIYSLPNDEFRAGKPDVADYTLEDLDLAIGERLLLEYDYGTTQEFLLTLTARRQMGRGQGTHFPWVTAMEGRGIIDDMDVAELKKLVEQIDRNGRTDEPVYYSNNGTPSKAPWDIRHFDLKVQNGLLKGDIEEIREGYAPFWEEMSTRDRKTPAKKKEVPSGKQDAGKRQKGKSSDAERDWKLFRERLPRWQERYMEELIQSYLVLLQRTEPASERFWELADRVEVDMFRPGVMVERVSRSSMAGIIAALLMDKAISVDDLEGFSDKLIRNLTESLSGRR
jgi:hypothetical protein